MRSPGYVCEARQKIAHHCLYDRFLVGHLPRKGGISLMDNGVTQFRNLEIMSLLFTISKKSDWLIESIQA